MNPSTVAEIRILQAAKHATEEWLKYPSGPKHKLELEAQLAELRIRIQVLIENQERKVITDRWDARIAAGQNLIIG